MSHTPLTRSQVPCYSINQKHKNTKGRTEMLHTTFAKLHKAGACREGYTKLARSLGGVNKYGKDTPIPLNKVIESNGLQDTIWTFRATNETSENLLLSSLVGVLNTSCISMRTSTLMIKATKGNRDGTGLHHR